MSKCIVPSNLKVGKLLERYSAPGDTNTHKDAVYFICHSIMHQMEFLKGRNMTHKGKKLPYFVPLSAVQLKKCLGSRNYKRIIDWMIKTEIIESDESWEGKVVSKGYRFTEHYLGAGHRWVTLTSPLGKKISFVKDENKNPFCPQVICRLKKCFDPSVLTIDANAALNEVKKIFEEDMTQALKCKKIDRRAQKILIARIRARKNENSINNFKTGNYSFTQDEFGFRFHSPLTRINKRLRQFIRCNGEILIQLDISGSQLYFGNYLLTPIDFENLEKSSTSINNKYKQHLYSSYNTIMFPLSYWRGLKNQYSKEFQRNLYFEKTVSGYFYEGIVNQLETINFFPPNKCLKQKRNQVKKTLLAMLFGNKMDMDQKRLYNKNNIQILNAFEAMYPDAAKLFNEIKAIDSKALCLLLQRIESICMIGLVCKRLQKEYPDITIYTIHDCIATTAKHLSTVRHIMEEEFAKFIGKAPKIDETPWLKIAA